MTKIKNQLFILLACLGLLFSCKKENGGNTPGSHNNAKNYSILVVDENNQPIANASVSDGDKEVLTGSSGTASFGSPKESYGKYRLGISKDGYFTGSVNLPTLASTDSSYKIMLLKATTTGTIPSSGGTVSGFDWTFTSTGGFKYEDGTAVTGNIDVAIRYIKPDNFEAVRAAFPGQDFTGINGGNEGRMYVYGWVAISYSQNGIKVYPAVSSVIIKVQVPGKYANAVQDGGSVFYYDEAAHIWEESASPTVSGLEVTMPLPSQTTFCALGKLYPTAIVKFKRTTCTPGDGYIYVDQIEMDSEKEQSIEQSLPGYCMPIANSNSLWYGCLSSDYMIYGNCPIGSQIIVDGTTTLTGNHFTEYDEGFYRPILAGYDYGIKIHSVRCPLSFTVDYQGQNVFDYLRTHNLISDKVIKEYSSFPAGTTNLGVINTVCDGSIPNPHENNNPNTGQGQVTYNGQTINGSCTSIVAQTTGCTGIDVVIMGDENFAIQNMPAASSGTFSVNGDGNNCNPYALTLWGGTANSISGSITKTGAKSFTFNIVMKDISTGVQKTATGSGVWTN